LDKFHEFLTQKREKSAFNTGLQALLGFEIQPLRLLDISPLDVYLWRHVKAVACSATTEDEETLHQRRLIPFKPLSTGPGTFKMRDGVWIRRVSIRALIQVQESSRLVDKR
jgi:hypothetical protein